MTSIFVKHNKFLLDLTWSTNIWFISLRTSARYLYLLLLTIILNICTSEDIVYCGTASSEITPHNQPIEDYMNELNMQELGILNDHLGFNQRDFLVWRDLQNQNQTNTVNDSNRIGWASLGLFIIGTTILFLYARYGTELRDFLFDLGRSTGNALVQGTRGLLQYAEQTGQEPLVRQFLTEQTQLLLNDPETAARVANGMRLIREFRQKTQN